MVLWIVCFVLLGGVAAFGAMVLRIVCVRRDMREGWEEKYVAASNHPVFQKTWRAGRDWLAHQETEEVEVQSEDGFLLHGLLIPHVTARATVLLFHGWRTSWELNFLCVLPFLHSLELQCLLVDERAQGDSEGRYMTLGVRERVDARVWVEYAANRFGRRHPLFLQGISMGAAAVLMASAYHFPANVRGIIADSGFTTPREIVSVAWRNKTPFPSGFPVWLLEQYARVFAGFSLKECSTLDAVRKTEYPVLFIHGTKDDFVPDYMSKRMYEACRSSKELVLVENAGHGMSYLTEKERVEAAYRAFIQKHLYADE